MWSCGGLVVRSTVNRAVGVGALAGDTVLCSSGKLKSHSSSPQPSLQMTYLSCMGGGREGIILHWVEDQPAAGAVEISAPRFMLQNTAQAPT